MQFKTLLSMAIAALLLSAGQAYAEVTANIGVTSNYIWRGVSQSNDESAVQGGIDFVCDKTDIYLGTWISNLSAGGGEEMDVYAGYSAEVNDIAYDVGLIYYHFPSNGTDFTELYGSVSYNVATFGLAYTAEVEGDGQDENDIFYYLSIGTDLQDDWSAALTLSAIEFDGDNDNEYSAVQLDLTKDAGDMGAFTFSVVKNDNKGLVTDEEFTPFVSWVKEL